MNKIISAKPQIYTEDENTYMKLEIIYSNGRTIEIPRLSLDDMVLVESNNEFGVINDSICINHKAKSIIRSLKINMLSDKDGISYKEGVKPREMTIAEIEKELGYSIKIKGINASFKCIKTGERFIKHFDSWEECHAWHKNHWNEVVLNG